jgi:TRAP-type mannitol/chloroaromatic compound transport system substrate-binding protein
MKQRYLSAIAAIGLVIAPAISFAQESIGLKMLNAWDDKFDGTRIVAHTFVENVTKLSKGRIKITMSGPEVVAPAQQFQPTSRGVFDLNFSTPIYYLGTSGVCFVLFGLPADSQRWRDKGYWDFCDKELQRFDQKLIAAPTSGSTDDFFQIILREPLATGDKPLAGRKIRGNKYYAPMVEPIGGSLVNLPGGEIYSALEKGVVDGAAWPVAGAERMRFQEVAKYMLRPRFGSSPFTLTMNLAKFNKLSKADQDLLLAAGHAVEKSTPKDFDGVAERSIAALKAAGVKEVTLDPALFKKLNAGINRGVWSTARTTPKTVARVQELYEMAKKNGDAE